MLLASALSLVLSAAPAIPSLAGKSVAVLGFGLDKSIVEQGQPRDPGPGLLQKPEDYYKGQQATADSAYAHFVRAVPSLFDGLNLLPIDSVLAKPGYRAAAECKPKKIFGREIFGCNDLSPRKGLFALSPAQAQENLDPFAKSLGLDYYFLFVNVTDYRFKVGVGDSKGGSLSGAAHMHLETTVHLMQPGKGSVWSASYGADAPTSFPVVKDILNEDNFLSAAPLVDSIAVPLRAELAKSIAKP